MHWLWNKTNLSQCLGVDSLEVGDSVKTYYCKIVSELVTNAGGKLFIRAKSVEYVNCMSMRIIV